MSEPRSRGKSTDLERTGSRGSGLRRRQSASQMARSGTATNLRGDSPAESDGDDSLGKAKKPPLDAPPARWCFGIIEKGPCCCGLFSKKWCLIVTIGNLVFVGVVAAILLTVALVPIAQLMIDNTTVDVETMLMRDPYPVIEPGAPPLEYAPPAGTQTSDYVPENGTAITSGVRRLDIGGGRFITQSAHPRSHFFLNATMLVHSGAILPAQAAWDGNGTNMNVLYQGELIGQVVMPPVWLPALGTARVEIGQEWIVPEDDTAFNKFSADALRLPEFEITFKTVDGLPVKLFNFWEIDGLEMETTVKWVLFSVFSSRYSVASRAYIHTSCSSSSHSPRPLLSFHTQTGSRA